MSQEQCDDPWFDVLDHLGFSPSEIDEANDHVFGRGTIEGSPGLKDEHLPSLTAPHHVENTARER